jgi:hypothetical protein
MALSVLDGGRCGLTYQAIRILVYVGAAVNRLFPDVLAVFQGFRGFPANRAMFFWNQPSLLPELFLTNPLRVR